MNWDRIIGLMGGRFDPPHLGHQDAVLGLFSNPGVKRVIVMPSATPPHKPARAPASDRLDLARAAFGALSGKGLAVEVSDLELREANRTKRPSYSFDTLTELRRTFPELAFVMGTDQFSKIQTWYRFPEVLNLCHWIVLERKDESNVAAKSVEKTLAEITEKGIIRRLDEKRYAVQLGGNASPKIIQICETAAREISSTQIREKIQLGLPVDQLISSDVFSLIRERKLYGHH